MVQSMRATLLRWISGVLVGSLISLSLIAQDSSSVVHHVSGRQPVQSPTHELAADRAIGSGSYVEKRKETATTSANPWQVLATVPSSTIIHDLSFATPTVGFAAAERGQVWKTTDGGVTWTAVMNLGAPYYWYGVHAMDAENVVISGFIDSSTVTGVSRWSHDGGATWSSDIILSNTGWSTRVRFASTSQGMVLDSINGSTAHYTIDGGAAAADWTQITLQPASWFGDEFSLLPDLNAAASGINYCTSSSGGVTWSCGSSIDSVFDGPLFFLDDNNGWVGGGTISPTVEGWLHRTTDGGKTWSGRVLDGPFPIREILFISPSMGWAAGGNIYSSIGGIYFSGDGGQSWSQDVNSSGYEMDACDVQFSGNAYMVWCAGYNSTFAGVVYGLQGAAAPVFTPPPQTYNAAQSVSLSSATPNATIYYTTDGSTPTTFSTIYTSPIPVSNTLTLQAIATAPTAAQSLVGAGVYDIVPPPQLQLSASAPSVSVTAGNPASVQLTVGASASAANVSFSCSGLPAGAQCSFVPGSLTAGPTPTQVTLTISTSPSSSSNRGVYLTGGLTLLFCGLLLLPASVFSAHKRKLVLCMGLLLAIAGCTVGCACCSNPVVVQNQPTPQPTPTPTPTPAPTVATITVTAAAAGAAPANATIQLTINP
jgi:photosystem II stability/assembly factor-like uncharacterized protein